MTSESYLEKMKTEHDMGDAEKALDIIWDSLPDEDKHNQSKQWFNIVRSALKNAGKVDGLVKALEFYADKKSYEFIHGTASYMPIEVDEGYKAREALAEFRRGG